MSGRGDTATARRLVAGLTRRGWHIATAESCSGGLLAAAFTDIPGASAVFDCGVISYADRIKADWLSVEPQTLADYGAVSEQTARQMAEGARRISGAELALSTTGIAGPDGGSPDKPCGLVYIALATDDGSIVRRNLFSGDRAAVREQTVAAALSLLEEYLQGVE
ncbi:MAG: CinA family protein [Bacillota bacterium]|nr:CinA family protein [Bacillota bacterium]